MDKDNIIKQMASYDFNKPISVTLIFDESDESDDCKLIKIEKDEEISNHNDTLCSHNNPLTTTNSNLFAECVQTKHFCESVQIIKEECCNVIADETLETLSKSHNNVNLRKDYNQSLQLNNPQRDSEKNQQSKASGTSYSQCRKRKSIDIMQTNTEKQQKICNNDENKSNNTADMPETSGKPIVDIPSKSNPRIYLFNNLLKTVSEYLIRLVDMHNCYLRVNNHSSNPRKKRQEVYDDFLRLRTQLLNLSYCSVTTLILPHENNQRFISTFINDTFNLAKTKKKILTCQQIYHAYEDMIKFVKEKRYSYERFILSTNDSPDQVNEYALSEVRTPNNKNERFAQSNNVQMRKVNEEPSLPTNHHIQWQRKMSNNIAAHSVNITPLHSGNNSTSNGCLPNINNGAELLTYHKGNQFQSIALPSPQVRLDMDQNISHQNQRMLYRTTEPKNTNLSNHYNETSQFHHASRDDASTPYTQRVHTDLNRTSLPSAAQQIPALPTYGQACHWNNLMALTPQIMDQTISHQNQLMPHLTPEPRNTNLSKNYIDTSKFSHASRDDASTPDTKRVHTDLNRTYHWQNQMALTQHNPINGQSAQHFNNQHSDQPETTRSISTDSGFISPLNFNSPAEAMLNTYTESETVTTSAPLITHVTSLNPKASYIHTGTCYVCSASTKNMCLDCLKVYYCSSACQKSDWLCHMLTCTKS